MSFADLVGGEGWIKNTDQGMGPSKCSVTVTLFFFFFLGFCLKIFQPLRMVYINKSKPKLKEASGLAVGNS